MNITEDRVQCFQFDLTEVLFTEQNFKTLLLNRDG